MQVEVGLLFSWFVLAGQLASLRDGAKRTLVRFCVRKEKDIHLFGGKKADRQTDRQTQTGVTGWVSHINNNARAYLEASYSQLLLLLCVRVIGWC